MKRSSQILLITFLLAVGSVKAQSGTDVYEYATVAGGFINTKPGLLVSFSNGEYKEVAFAKNEFPSGQTAYLKYIAQLSKEGWEVVSLSYTSSTNNVPTYLLKRKLKESK